MNAFAIAQHLNIAEQAIIEIQEWTSVLWVRIQDIGARFVSKKVIPQENKFDRAEKFLKACTYEEIQITADTMYSIEPFTTRTTLVTVPMTKEQLASAIIDAEEKKMAAERGELFYSVTGWYKEYINEASLINLKIGADRLGVKTTYKTYRPRKVRKTKEDLINTLLYETDYADYF